jgi:hypothetical protein
MTGLIVASLITTFFFLFVLILISRFAAKCLIGGGGYRNIDRCKSFCRSAGTGMWTLVAWLCSQVAMSCAVAPDIAVIQTAYEREAATGSKLHDKDLEVLQAKCHDGAAGGFLCEVTFISKSDPAERLYFDIVAVARDAGGWELKSGLCKR